VTTSTPHDGHATGTGSKGTTGHARRGVRPTEPLGVALRTPAETFRIRQHRRVLLPVPAPDLEREPVGGIHVAVSTTVSHD